VRVNNLLTGNNLFSVTSVTVTSSITRRFFYDLRKTNIIKATQKEGKQYDNAIHGQVL
jgi:hypothetical protein